MNIKKLGIFLLTILLLLLWSLLQTFSSLILIIVLLFAIGLDSDVGWEYWLSLSTTSSVILLWEWFIFG